MHTLSRRQFLRRSSAFAAMFCLPVAGRTPELVQGMAAILGTSLGMPDALQVSGRAFSRTGVHERPEPTSPLTGYLMPDSIQSILDLSEDGWWYRLPEGYVPREAMQPIVLSSPPAPEDENGHYEVVAPLTTIRDYCSGLAPILGRIAFGAVVYVHDRLTDDNGQVWYAVSGSQSGAGVFGWAPAAHFRRWTQAGSPMLESPAIWIDTHHHKLTVYDGERLIGESAIHSKPLLRGAGVFMAFAPSTWTMQPPFVRPWVMALRGGTGAPAQVHGVYWHNRFGTGSSGTHIELPTFAARWLFSMMSSARQTEIPTIIE